ncbi:DUF4249 family protein [Flavivirga eckloniae]|uniref:DUF4249 domain-containing protein n=1 Tax=Flavivirga eckloniae TaxID=1803846 RepID=A0A2K9PV80_9FLAO|nr:DUF4249 family protein [Flavivirga eckloniae]AUP80961.1 hypothetical protein C1H87_20500 [Flavivirga eckloniae]
MKPINQISIYILVSLMLASCTTEIPNDINFEPQVFISGAITDEKEYVTIKIQRTVPVNNLGNDPINNAQISLYTKNVSGDRELVTSSFNSAEGIYKSSEMITSIVGNTYWIEIQLADGTFFKSDEEVLKEKIIISDVELTYDYNRVTFADPVDDANFYLISLKVIDHQDPDPEKFSKTLGLTNDVLFNGSDKATFDDSYHLYGTPRNLDVHVSISNLNFNTYQYYLNQLDQYEAQIGIGVEEGTNDIGLLFLPPPPNLIGNIMNMTTNTRALGFFGVQNTTKFVKTY